MNNDLAYEIKQRLTAREVIESYGFHPNRGGFIQCPFHDGDKHGSLKIYDGDRGWHCFGCNKGGSVIDFVMEYFGLKFYDACLKLNDDFGLHLSGKRPTKSEISALVKAKQETEKRKKAAEEEYMKMTEKRRYWWNIVKQFEPQNGSAYIHPLYAEALKQLPYLDWWLEEHFGRS